MAVPNHYPDLFYQFSKLVTGEEALSAKLSNVYFEVFHADPAVQTDFLRLLDRYAEILNNRNGDPEKSVKDKILGDPALNAITLSIIKLWYLGIIQSLTTNTLNTEPLKGGGYYFHHEALIWKIAQAHPAGLSGGYYGYWSYKPEN
jgi:hypothetical protein